jgi:peptidoglycan/LPS O-acetylase OafA/YrhL
MCCTAPGQRCHRSESALKLRHQKPPGRASSTDVSTGIFIMRLKQLDTIRAFAIGLVMVEHFGGHGLNQHIPIGAGSVGVGLFFTLSGFLITGILLQSFDAGVENKRAVWLDFYARRLLRLVPPYFAVIATLVAMGIAPIATSWPLDISYLTNVYIARGGASTVFWSLSVEEQFYLLWPLVIAFAPRRWLVPAILAMGGLSLLFKLGIALGGYDTSSATRLLFANLVLLGAGCLPTASPGIRGVSASTSPSRRGPAWARLFSPGPCFPRKAAWCAITAMTFWSALFMRGRSSMPLSASAALQAKSSTARPCSISGASAMACTWRTIGCPAS